MELPGHNEMYKLQSLCSNIKGWKALSQQVFTKLRVDFPNRRIEIPVCHLSISGLSRTHREPSPLRGRKKLGEGVVSWTDKPTTSRIVLLHTKFHSGRLACGAGSESELKIHVQGARIGIVTAVVRFQATRRAGLPTLTPPSKKKGGVVLPESEWIPIAKESDFGVRHGLSLSALPSPVTTAEMENLGCNGLIS